MKVENENGGVTVYVDSIVLSDFKIEQTKERVFREKYGRDGGPGLVLVCMPYRVDKEAIESYCSLCGGKLYHLPKDSRFMRKICNTCYQEYNG